jgi:ketosteroid isomerase-like protein
MDPKIDWTEAARYIYGGTYVGPDAIFEGVFTRLGSEWEGFRADVDFIVVEGNRTASVGTYSGRYAATGRDCSARFAHAFTVADGKVVKFEQVIDSAEVNRAL